MQAFPYFEPATHPSTARTNVWAVAESESSEQRAEQCSARERIGGSSRWGERNAAPSRFPCACDRDSPAPSRAPGRIGLVPLVPRVSPSETKNERRTDSRPVAAPLPPRVAAEREPRVRT